MTAVTSIDPARFLDEQLAQASPDLMRQMLSSFIHALLSADADTVCGGEYRRPSSERTNTRNGYRHRDLDTRVGTIDVAIPRVREGSYFPDWLLVRRKRAEAALTPWSPPATCWGSRPGGWNDWSKRWASPGCPVPGIRDGQRPRRQSR